MDTLSTEDSITRSAELMLRRKRKRARNRANRKERQQRLDQMLKNLVVMKNEESSIEESSIQKSDAQLLRLGHLEIQTESTTTLLKKSPGKKKRRKKRSVMKPLNEKVDPCCMDQNNVPSNPILLDNKHGAEENGLLNSVAQLLPPGQLEIKTEVTTTLLEKCPTKKKRRKKRSVIKVLNKKVDPCCMDQNNVPSNPSLLDYKHGQVENGLLNPNISIEDVASLENSVAQLLPPGQLEIKTEVTTTLLEKCPTKKKRRKKRSVMKVLNKKVDPCCMDQNNVPSNPSLLDYKHGHVENGLLNPNISIEDVASLENSVAQLLPPGQLEIKTEVTTTLLEKCPTKKKRRKKRSVMKVLNKKVDPCCMDQNNVPSNPSLLDNKHGQVENGLLNPNISIEDVASLENSDAQLLPLGHLEIQTEATTTFLEKSPVKKKRRKKRSVMRALNKKVDPCSMDQSNVPSNISLLDNKHGEVENGLLNPNISIEDVASLESSDAQLLPQGNLEIQAEATAPLLKKNPVKKKRWKRRSMMKVLNEKVDPCSLGLNNVPSNPSLLDNKQGEVESGLLNSNISINDAVSSKRKATEALCMADVNFSLSAPSSDLVNELEQPKRDDVKVINGSIEGEVSFLEAGRTSAESCSERIRLTHNSELIMHVHSAPIRSGGFCMMRGPHLRRKLLILDVNGLLADVVNPPPKDGRPDACFARRAIFKRPYCNDFLKFCFERFDVGIWSSRSKKIIVKVVDYLLGSLKHKLLFCWDMSHSTQTMFKTLENKHKPLVCKELSKVWDRYDPNLPWERGDYDESNTLLLDDSPYKALLNPAHTAIFPHSYNFKAENDNSLGPGGDLRIYLEELLKAEHVQKHVEQHPFGQRAIDQTSSDWNFYFDVLCSLHGQSGQHS